MAGFGVAGLLLVNLAASAQLSDDTSTFNGEVAASCSFDLRDEISLVYNANRNYMNGGSDFDLMTNSPNIRMSFSQFTVGSEPAPVHSSMVRRVTLFHKEGGTSTNIANTDTQSVSDSIAVSTSGANTFRIYMAVLTEDYVNLLYGLGPGDYSYSVTLSCLL